MAVPQVVREVPRPKNTVVIPYGKDKAGFAVRSRTGCKYKDGKRYPVNGPIIGYIIGMQYVPKDPDEYIIPVSKCPIDLKQWANVVLCNNVASQLLDELCIVYNKNDALKIYVSAILRVSFPNIKDCELKEKYEESFLSEIFEGVALSKNTISDFWKNLGKAYSKINEFMELRVKAVEQGHHVIIDGTLKSNESEINSFSNYSRKAQLKGSRDISILYAYDLEAEEPICSKCYPGNMSDSVAYKDFISSYGMTKGIIVGDKAFSSSCAGDQIESNIDLHYVNPLKNNSRYIKEYNLTDYEGILDSREFLLYKKVKVKNENKWLYFYQDIKLAGKANESWMQKHRKNEVFDREAYFLSREKFGTILIESDLDLEPITIYKTYESRWEIELVMRFYKQACEFDETREHSDYSVIGSELCNFVASVITYRIKKAFDKQNLFKKYTYCGIIKKLQRIQKYRLKDKGWDFINLHPHEWHLLWGLGLVAKPEPKKRGPKPQQSV